jgi:iron-sulfur cluster assembly protein
MDRPAARPPEVPALRFTERAAGAVLARAREAGVAGFFLRVAVVAGGCNGLCYELYFVESPGPTDAVLQCGALPVLVGAGSLALLAGTTVDLDAGRPPLFRFDNPRARRRCSCGASFEV